MCHRKFKYNTIHGCISATKVAAWLDLSCHHAALFACCLLLQVDSLEQALLAALPLGPQAAAGGVSLPDFFRVKTHHIYHCRQLACLAYRALEDLSSLTQQQWYCKVCGMTCHNFKLRSLDVRPCLCYAGANEPLLRVGLISAMRCFDTHPMCESMLARSKLRYPVCHVTQI